MIQPATWVLATSHGCMHAAGGPGWSERGRSGRQGRGRGISKLQNLQLQLQAEVGTEGGDGSAAVRQDEVNGQPQEGGIAGGSEQPERERQEGAEAAQEPGQ